MKNIERISKKIQSSKYKQTTVGKRGQTPLIPAEAGGFLNLSEASLVYRVRSYLKNKSQITGVVQKSKARVLELETSWGKERGGRQTYSVNHFTRDRQARAKFV